MVADRIPSTRSSSEFGITLSWVPAAAATAAGAGVGLPPEGDNASEEEVAMGVGVLLAAVSEPWSAGPGVGTRVD